MGHKAKEAPLHAVMLILGQGAPHGQQACADGLGARAVLLATRGAPICAAEDSAERCLKLLAPHLQADHALPCVEEGVGRAVLLATRGAPIC